MEFSAWRGVHVRASLPIHSSDVPRPGHKSSTILSPLLLCESGLEGRGGGLPAAPRPGSAQMRRVRLPAAEASAR